VFSIKRDKFLNTGLRNGYINVSLYKNGRKHCKNIHRLVAKTFMENNEMFPIVDHIDKNKKNNNVSNLRWTTQQKNMQNKTNNTEYVNINVENNIYRVRFVFNWINKSFENLRDAIEFRDIIQTKIDNNENICPIFIELYHNEMKHIYKVKNGYYQIQIRKANLQFTRTYKILEEARQKRNELLREYYKII
jgi:hypothetical protein